NPHKVLAQPADVVLNLPRGTLANCHTAEEGAHPNADAQGGKHAAQPMTCQSAQGDVHNDDKARPCRAGVSSCRWHQPPPLLSRLQLLHATSSAGPPTPSRVIVLQQHRRVRPMLALPYGVSCLKAV